MEKADLGKRGLLPISQVFPDDVTVTLTYLYEPESDASPYLVMPSRKL